jgi:hypothetical protein
MSFRYLLTDPSGTVHVADSPDEFDALLERLQSEFPDGEIEGDAVVVTDKQTPSPMNQDQSCEGKNKRAPNGLEPAKVHSMKGTEDNGERI